MLHKHLTFEMVVRTEMSALIEEGYDVQNLKKWVDKLDSDSIERALVTDEFWKRVDAVKKEARDEEEPSQLSSIRALRPERKFKKNEKIADKELQNKVYGAWLARCVGCTLGKPIEGWSRNKIRDYLQTADAYPLDFYVPAVTPEPPGIEPWKDYARTTRGNITKMVRDDDTDYTIIGLKILETCGRSFTTENIGYLWLENFPYYEIFTAEAAAYRNLVNDISPPETASYRNPYREYIGAQIRADMWGYVNPGDPEMAAEMAFRDSALSHTKNGIYGEMWAAACIAVAFVENDPLKIIQAGLAEIPENSRLSKAVRQTVDWAVQLRDWEKVADKITEHFDKYDPIHVINNTCMIVLGLLLGEGDFTNTLCITLMGGYDTDCTCATVGSVLGAIMGAEDLPRKWIDPLNNKVDSLIRGFERSNIQDLAKRTMRFVKND